MFGYLASFFTSTTPLQAENVSHMLAMLWHCKKISHVKEVVNKLTNANEQAPLIFIQELSADKVASHTYRIVKEILIHYNAPSWGVCKYIADNLDKPVIGPVFAISIGTEKEKSRWNKEFYHKIRVIKGMELGQWRKYLKDIRTKLDNVPPKSNTEQCHYTLGLFDEPLCKTVFNTSMENPILSIYKGKITKNKHFRSPIEVELDQTLTQQDVLKFVSEKDVNENLVIIAKKVGKDVNPPEGVYVCFMEETESFSDRVYPYIDNVDYSSVKNFFALT